MSIAEERGKGALAMLADGLLERFPFDEIYGLHNMPGLPPGTFRARDGAAMSAEDNFAIVLNGVGGHASRPDAGRDVLVAPCALALSLQTIVSRRVAPGCLAFIGNGEDAKPLHNPECDFNDQALPHGANFFVRIARDRLSTREPRHD